MLVRTFRLPPGRLVYTDLPAEAVDGVTVAQVASWCARLLSGSGSRSRSGRGGTAGGGQDWHDVLRALWGARTWEEYELSALERGFRDVAEAVRLAREFDLDLVRGLAGVEAVAG